MESRLKALGHPVHPMLVMFPAALLVTAVIFDVVDVVGGPDFLGEVAYWNIVVGVVVGVLAMAAGAVDLLAIPAGTRAKRIGVTHALINTCVILLFAGIWAVRFAADRRGAGGGLIAIELVAMIGVGLGAWFGGELVDRLGVGVDREADLNASNSLLAQAQSAPERLRHPESAG
ncbi:DUF2231 domain-containing protein [Micromonospora sp. NPDC049559]|uniref:DUF2231 domain-containing protein n=1 Tax=Micromonospora sp. NPDC049559 TaxID=3155923 RepID=UPI003423BC73